MSHKQPPYFAGQHGADSVRALLKTLPANWRRMEGASVKALIDRCLDELCAWEEDAAVRHMQRAVGYLTLGLELVLAGASPSITPAPAVDKDNDQRDRRGARPRGKRRRRTSEELTAYAAAQQEATA